MRENEHGIRLGRLAAALVALTIGVGGPAPAAVAATPDVDHVRPCPPGLADQPADPRRPRMVVRGDVGPGGRSRGAVLRTAGNRSLRLGARGFADGPFGWSAVVGSRRAHDTTVVVLDLRRRCAAWRLAVPALVYGSHLDTVTGSLFLSLVEPRTRRELGIWRVDPDQPGRTHLEVPPPRSAVGSAVPRTGEIRWEDGPVGRWCAGGRCEERRPDDRLGPAVSAPDADGTDSDLAQVSSWQVPEEPAPRWPRDAVLTWRWHGSETPPTWIRDALRAAADDVRQSRRSRTPTFEHDPDATDTFRYTSSFPATACSTAIACASYTVGESWTVRLRTHGTDFRWGRLRWCQADDRDGCFDAERIALHELGHIVGIDHPESAGFQLRPMETVMHQVSPSRPKAGAGMHVFGPCDVATLQERYDVPSATTAISTCNAVDTALTLTSSGTFVSRGDTVTLTASLRIVDRDAYGRLGGNPLSERSVQLRRRPVGGLTSWTTFWMRPGTSPGTYLLSISPTTSYEFQAVFAAPDTEGLRDSASSVVTIRLMNGCVASCYDTGDEMS